MWCICTGVWPSLLRKCGRQNRKCGCPRSGGGRDSCYFFHTVCNLLSIRTPFFNNEEKIVHILCPMGSDESVPKMSPSPMQEGNWAGSEVSRPRCVCPQEGTAAPPMLPAINMRKFQFPAAFFLNKRPPSCVWEGELEILPCRACRWVIHAHHQGRWVHAWRANADLWKSQPPLAIVFWS